MNSKSKSNLIWSIILFTICGSGVFWYIKDVGLLTKNSTVEYKKGEDVIFNAISSLQGIPSEEFLKILGEPKEIYKEKIYTYIDAFAQYDFLVEDTIKSVVMSMKYGLSIVSVDQILEVLINDYNKDDIKDYKTEKVHDRTVVAIYNVGKYSKLEIGTKEDSSLIDYIKIKYA